ncbi:hypothetical protein JTB14_009796 [Gonioctena quinquepunctata]|nr:hypothetical protein JTB14_009796 [Gonioctena quinquepunctata]
MAMVLSSQSRLLVALCSTLLVMAGALAVGSFTGWFQQGIGSEPVPAKLRQGALDQLKIFQDPNMAGEQCKTDFQVCMHRSPNVIR